MVSLCCQCNLKSRLPFSKGKNQLHCEKYRKLLKTLQKLKYVGIYWVC